MDPDSLYDILQSCLLLNQSHGLSFVFTQILKDVKKAADEKNIGLLNQHLTLSFKVLESICDYFSVDSTQDGNPKSKGGFFGAAISFCEKIITLLFALKKELGNTCNEDVTENIHRITTFMVTFNNGLYRLGQLKCLHEMGTETIQPSVYEEWENEVLKSNFAHPSHAAVHAINSNQFLLFQAAQTNENHNLFGIASSVPTKSVCLGKIFKNSVLRSCEAFLRDGRSLGAAEVLTNFGLDAVTELTNIAENSFDWQISENAIFFLGEIGHFPPVETVSVFTVLAYCFSICPCQLPGFTNMFVNSETGEVCYSSLDPVLKLYYNEDEQINLSFEHCSHECCPLSFPLSWIQQLTAQQRKQIQNSCNSLRGVSAMTPSETISDEEIDLLVSKAEYFKFLLFVITQQSSLIDFMVRSVNLKMPTFFKYKCLTNVDLGFMENQDKIQLLIGVLPVNEVARLISVSPIKSSNLLVRKGQNIHKLLLNTAVLCFDLDFVSVFLWMSRSSTLGFFEIANSLENRPTWFEFFKLSRDYLVGDDENGKLIDETFVDKCCEFVGKDNPVTEKLYSYFLNQLQKKQSDTAVIESPEFFSNYSKFLSSLFHDVQDVQLEDSRLLYSLLRCNIVFDVTKLFGFQKFNYLATEEAEETLKVTFGDDDAFPPSFLRASISSVPPPARTLSKNIKKPESVSFLGFGRPLRAVLQHLLLSGRYSGSALSRQRSKIEERVFNLAIENSDNPSIVASCILYLKILGFSVEKLQCALCILRLLGNNDEMDVKDLSELTKTTLSPTASPTKNLHCPVTFCKLAFWHKDHFIGELESICLNELASVNFDIYSSVSTLTVLDRLESESEDQNSVLRSVWSRLLLNLATANNWLNFFTYAELLQVEPEETLHLASWFSDPQVKSHVVKTARGVANSRIVEDSPSKEAKSPGFRRKKRKSKREAFGTSSESDEKAGQTPQSSSKRQRSTSMIFSREQDLLNIALQIASSEDGNEFKEFLDAAARTRNPLCAIYAACLPEADRITCLIVYFECYFPEVVARSNELPAIIDQLAVKRAYKTLFDGFSILLPACPLCKLFKAAISLATLHSLDEFKSDLNQFSLALEYFDSEMMGEELSLESIAFIGGHFLTRLLYEAESVNLLLLRILEIYSECRISGVVTWPLKLSPKQLLGLTNQMVLGHDDSDKKFEAQPISWLLSDDVISLKWSIISELQSRGQYVRARLVGQLLGVPLSEILIKEFKHRYTCITTNGAPSTKSLIEFWRTFNEAKRQSVAAMAISSQQLLDLLQQLLEESCKSNLEQALVAYEIGRVTATGDGCCEPRANIFLVFYSNFLQFYCEMVSLPEGSAELSSSPASLLFDEYFESTSKIKSRSSSTNRLLHCHYDVNDLMSTASNDAASGMNLHSLASSEVGQMAFKMLLHDLLEYGYIADALLLNKIVGNRSTELLVVKLCTDLVRGRIGITELPPPYSDCATVSQAMEKMASDCGSMKIHIQRLRLYHSISLECSIPYSQVENMATLTLCESLLRRATYTAFDLIAELFRSGDLLAPEDYAALVCQYVIKYWTTDFEIVSTATTDRPVGFDDMASRLFQLCPDQTILGNQLVQGVGQLLGQANRGFHELSAAVDVLIHAHDAFAQNNNVEGIASALHLARSLSHELESNPEDANLQLLVKMMHSIGRYGEMSYVLDVLYQNGKLPLVFQMRPRPDCEAQFRTSLLEFLRGVSGQSASGQPDLYRHVCLQYGMEREVAQLLFDSANSEVAELGRLSHSVELNSWASDASHSLPLIAQKFVDAAKGYARAECPNQADRCIRQARLLALQLRFLSEGAVSTASAVAVQQQQQQMTSTASNISSQPNSLIIVGRTNPDRIKEIIIQQTIAFECLIISEAYKVDYWTEAVFRQVVLLAKNSRYFHDLMAFYPLTDKFFEEIVSLAEQYNSSLYQQLNGQQMSRLKRILHYCPDWTVQYHLATRLGFADLQVELANSQATPLIKDLIDSKKLPPPSTVK